MEIFSLNNYLLAELTHWKQDLLMGSHGYKQLCWLCLKQAPHLGTENSPAAHFTAIYI